MSEVLLQLIKELHSGRLRVVDLTLPLSSATPLLPLPPQWNNTPPFTLRELSRYDERGPAWYWNAFETGEHTGQDHLERLAIDLLRLERVQVEVRHLVRHDPAADAEIEAPARHLIEHADLL